MPPTTDPARARDPSVSLWTALAFGAVAAVTVMRPFGRGQGRPGATALAADQGRVAARSGAPADQGGHSATTPSDLSLRSWVDILKRVAQEIGDDRVVSVAASVTFYALLSLFPAIVALVSIYGLFANASTISEHVNALSGILPGGALDVIGEQVKRIASKPSGSLGIGFAVGLATALWSANAAMKAVFDALNVVYDEKEKRGFVLLNALSLAFTVGAILFLILAFGAVVVIPTVFNLIGVPHAVELVVGLARWPLLLVVIVLGIAVLYRYGPSRKKPQWRWVTWGSGFAAVAWVVGSMLFSWYVSKFGSYNETYGSLGAAIGFMTWIWISATIVLVGAEINAEMEHQTAQDTTKGGAKPLGARGAAMADRVA